MRTCIFIWQTKKIFSNKGNSTTTIIQGKISLRTWLTNNKRNDELKAQKHYGAEKLNCTNYKEMLFEANRLRKRLSHIYHKIPKVQEDYLYNTEMRANALRKEGKIDEAISLTSDLLKKQPENPSHYISLVNDHLKTGDYYSALAFAEED